MVRTRIAPSPTGSPHIGTIYQALFNFSFAKKYGGDFIVRIEDTDKERFVAGAEQKIYDVLDWFGLAEKESPRKGGKFGPYRQSERLSLYQKYAKELVEKGHAYYCFCTRARLEEVRQKMQQEGKPPMYDKHCRNMSRIDADKILTNSGSWVIRLKVPENRKIIIKDGIRGEVSFESGTVDDQVLLKSDGYPTYHLAVVIDDHLMEITHVVRGEEWLPSSPKHFLLYDFLGWEKPLFFHTPVLRNPDKSKFSKRSGHTSLSFYQEQGFLPEAILNYLALMGWSHPSGKEIFDLDEFVKTFELKDLSPAGPIFDLKKLEWMNGEYIRQSQKSKVKSQIYDFYHGKFPEDDIEKILPLLQDRLKKLSEWEELTWFFRERPVTFEESPDANIIKEIIPVLNDCEWVKDKMEEKMRGLAEKLGIKAGQIFMALRDAVTGKKATPPILESMIILGKEESMARLNVCSSENSI